MWNQTKTVLLLGALSALLVGVGGAVAPGALPLFLGFAVVMNLGAYFFSDRLVLGLSGAREVSAAEAPELHGLVAELAERADLPMPRVYLLPDAQPNAFATGRNPRHAAVAVTAGLLELLDRRELRGVLAHELAHIKNRDILVGTVAATIASAISGLGQALSFALFLGRDDEDGGGLLFALLAPVAATLLQLGVSRSREYLADEEGARIAGDAEGLARALERLERRAARLPSQVARPGTASLYIVNPFAGAAALRLFSTHPPLAERVRRLRALAAAEPRRRLLLDWLGY